MAEATQANLDSMLARLVVEQGLATPREVEDCQRLQQQVGGGGDGNGSLADVLVTNGVVTKRQVDRLKGQLVAEETSSGQQIPGFQILEKLGSGAMATVYKARQLSLDRLVAIKVLPRKQTNNPQFVERFYAEGRAAAKLNHPNIVQAYDVGRAGEYHYFAMEYVEGRTVFDDIAKLKRYPEKEALRIIIQIARALEHSHKAGFIHRDVKPKNIMLMKDGTAKLADMGLARAVTDREAAESEAGKAFGTPYYISPEQIRGDRDVDFRADIYGLGATFYHMVTGQVPFDGPNPTAVMHKHLKSPLVPPDHINPSLTAGIGEIIESCMAKNRKERYASTTDLLTDLEAVARGEAPLQARKRFDIDKLSALEPGEDYKAALARHFPSVKPMWRQPIFWVAVAGWGSVAGLLAVYNFIIHG